MVFFILIFFLLLMFGMMYIISPAKSKPKVITKLPEIVSERKYLRDKEFEEIVFLPKATINFEPYYLVFDLETTGLIKGKDSHPFYDKEKFPEIVQIGWMLINKEKELIEEKEFLILQTKKIPKKSTEIHGITTSVANTHGVPIREVLELFKIELKRSQKVIAHNFIFDFDIVQSACYKNNIEAPNVPNNYCTMLHGVDYCQLPKYASYEYKYPSLSELFKRCFFPEYKYLNNFSTKHNALADSRITAACYFRMRNLK